MNFEQWPSKPAWRRWLTWWFVSLFTDKLRQFKHFFFLKKSPQLFIYSKKCLFIDGACCKTSRARGLCRWRCTLLPMRTRSRDLISCWGCVRHMRSRDLISWLVCQRQRAAWWSELLPGQPAGTVCVCEMKKQKHTTTLKLLNKNKCK